MRRGTGPTLKFTTPYAASIIEYGYITFDQRGKTVFEARLSDANVTVMDNAIKITLTQEQTLSLSTAVPCEVQIRAVLTSGKPVASNIPKIPVCRILKEGTI